MNDYCWRRVSVAKLLNNNKSWFKIKYKKKKQKYQVNENVLQKKYHQIFKQLVIQKWILKPRSFHATWRLNYKKKTRCFIVSGGKLWILIYRQQINTTTYNGNIHQRSICAFHLWNWLRLSWKLSTQLLSPYTNNKYSLFCCSFGVFFHMNSTFL